MRAAFPAILLAPLLCTGLAAQSTADGANDERGGPRGTEILWDTYGIPHIIADDPDGLFYASGWAQMHNHGNLLLRLYGQARGRAAEYWGEEYGASDIWVRTMGIPTRAARWNELQELAFQGYQQAFARGINDYAGEHADQIDDTVEVVLPIVSSDILAHYQRVIHFTFVVNRSNATALGRSVTGGSNAWAIAPSRSASGNAMLLANPHLPWGDYFTFMEIQLTAPGINATGAVLVGMPTPTIAFNDHLGWTHTVNTQDGADFYQLTLAEGGYRWNDATTAFVEQEQTLAIRGVDGSVREERLVIRHSIHGPVIAQGRGVALALRVVGLDRPHSLQHYWEMLLATDLQEFEAAMKRQQIPMFTVIYADRDGHIMHLFGGLTPVRTHGDWKHWSEWVSGETSATLWTETHAYGDLPRVVDPPSGWLQNANDPPWTTTFPRALDPTDFPAYMAPREMSFRAQRSARMLAEDEEISFDEMIRYKHSTRMELADRLLDDLLAAVDKHGDALAKDAARVLAAWDRRADAGSRGAVLFQTFYDVLRRGGRVFSTPWTSAAPRTTPNGLASLTAAAQALSDAARRVQQTHGRLDVPWGDVHRLRAPGVNLPASGGPGNLGIFRVLDFQPTRDGRVAATGGDSYLAAIEFSEPLRARTLLSYGNASQPGSPHRTDQLELLSRNELRPVWRTRTEIEAHLEKREVF